MTADQIDMPRAEPLRDVTDEQLVERARGGDLDGYGELVRRHQTAALRLAAGVCGSTEEARDIVQDALVKGHRLLGQYRGEASVRSWLLRIVANDAKNALRARSRRRGREDRYEALHHLGTTGSDPVADRAVVDADAADLIAALAALDARDREILACRFVAGLSEQETAATLGVPAGTVKSRTSRALARARSILGEEATPDG